MTVIAMRFTSVTVESRQSVSTERNLIGNIPRLLFGFLPKATNSLSMAFPPSSLHLRNGLPTLRPLGRLIRTRGPRLAGRRTRIVGRSLFTVGWQFGHHLFCRTLFASYFLIPARKYSVMYVFVCRLSYELYSNTITYHCIVTTTASKQAHIANICEAKGAPTAPSKEKLNQPRREPPLFIGDSSSEEIEGVLRRPKSKPLGFSGVSGRELIRADGKRFGMSSETAGVYCTFSVRGVLFSGGETDLNCCVAASSLSSAAVLFFSKSIALAKELLGGILGSFRGFVCSS